MAGAGHWVSLREIDWVPSMKQVTSGLALIASLVGFGAQCAVVRPQAVLYIDTDAVVPHQQQPRFRTTEPGMVTRARIMFLDEQFRLCSECSRDYVLTSNTLWPLSVGIAASHSSRYVRVLLIQNARPGPSGEFSPSDPGVVDVVARLRFGDEISRQLITVPFDCVGVGADLNARESCADGHRRVPIRDTQLLSQPPTTVTNTWRASHRVDCQSEPLAGAALEDVPTARVCIPGGVFWMGNSNSEGDGPAYDAIPEHPVAVSPFHMDRFEYTVGRYLRASLGPGERALVDERLRSYYRPTWCNTAKPSPEDLPFNCVPWETAQTLCALEGGRLPTEAEWEWAAQGREEERRFPWGNRQPECGYAPGYLPCRTCPSDQYIEYCVARRLEFTEGGGARWQRYLDHSDPFIHYWQDQTLDGVFAMGSGLEEWTTDRYQFYSEPCWSPPSEDTV